MTDQGGLIDRALRRVAIEEFLVDFLGGLVPGILFYVGSMVLLIPLSYRLTLLGEDGARRGLSEGIASMVAATQNTPGTLWLAAFLMFLLLAYVTGHLFYRHDPRIPDQASFRHLVRSAQFRRPEKRQLRLWDLLVWYRTPWELADKRRMKQELGCGSFDACLFPYPDYDHYLEKRRLRHLKKFCLWTASAAHRSKNYVNLLKIRIRHVAPERTGVIIRNEAHVRLASSTWYVARLLALMSLASVVAVGVVTVLTWDSYGSRADAWLASYPALMSSAAVLGMSVFARITIQHFFHYQRMREVFFVLETARAVLGMPPDLESGDPN